MLASTQEKQISTATEETYELIKGTFSPAEASEIVNDLFFKKINFHKIRNFSQQERFGTDHQGSQQRIAELKLAQEQASEIIADARRTGKSLRVSSTISIEVI